MCEKQRNECKKAKSIQGNSKYVVIIGKVINKTFINLSFVRCSGNHTSYC